MCVPHKLEFRRNFVTDSLVKADVLLELSTLKIAIFCLCHYQLP